MKRIDDGQAVELTAADLAELLLRPLVRHEAAGMVEGRLGIRAGEANLFPEHRCEVGEGVVRINLVVEEL